MQQYQPASDEQSVGMSEKATPDPGFAVIGPFLDLYERLGPEICGPPLSDPMELDGLPVQFFERVVMEEYEPGHVRLKAIGQQLLDQHLRALRERTRAQPIGLEGVVDVIHEMAYHAEMRYETRPLSNIRYLVIHHTRTSPDVPPHELARQHVERIGWPGIGYHFVVAADGTVYQTNDLRTVSFHARQFNPMAVGIALAGEFSSQGPPAVQVDSVARLCVYLLRELDLPVESVRGHRDLVYTTCPGDQWVVGEVWRDVLRDRIRRMVSGEE